MLRVSVPLLCLLVSAASACTYFCPTVEGEYVCCDGGDATDTIEVVVDLPSECYYYCGYEGVPYCCGDPSQPIPDNHDAHDGRCPEESEQLCKSSGIYLLPKKSKVAKTSGAVQLTSQSGKDLPSCASDGYCTSDEKCCASHCGRKHVCMKSLTSSDEDKEKKEE